MEGLGAGAFAWTRAMAVPVAASCSAPVVAEEGTDFIARVCLMQGEMRNCLMACWNLPEKREDSLRSQAQRRRLHVGRLPEDFALLLQPDDRHQR